MSRHRFADIELDVDRFVVTRAGRRLSLEPKALDVLRALVERPGRLVTKDELLDLAWPGVAVTPNALTRVVAQLRRELGDDATDAKFIETVPTRGYRFIAEVEAVEQRPLPAEPPPAGVAIGAPVPDAPPPLVPPAPPAPPSTRAGPLPWLGLAATVVVLAVVARIATMPPAVAVIVNVPTTASRDRFRPVHDETGSILDAVHAPTGRWLAVVSDRSGDFEISLRDVATGTSRPLTADGMRNVHPAWSPDAGRLAYHSARRRGIWTIDVDGGTARQIAPYGSRPAWSPDGRTIVFQSDEWLSEQAQPGSHLLLVPADGSAPPRALTTAGDPPGGHGSPRWTADGTTVYFVSARNVPIDFWSVRVRDGLLTQRAANWTTRVLALSDGPGGPVVWGVDRGPAAPRLVRIPVGDGMAPVPDVVVGELPAGVRAASVAPDGRTAALVFLDAVEDIWTVPVTGAGAPTAAPRRVGPGGHPAISPDGERVAYDLGTEIRVRRLDGSEERTVAGGGLRALYPTWRDDRRLFAIRQNGLTPYLIEADLETGTVTERLRLPEAASFPRVAPDGDTVVATLGEPLSRLGRGSISAGTFAEWPLFDGYSFGVWSPDGRRLALERKVDGHMPTYVADAVTGAAEPVTPFDGQYWPGSFSPDGRRLALAVLTGATTWTIEVLDLDSQARRPVARAGSPETVLRYPSWSPRGDVIAYTRYELHGSLQLADLGSRPTATR